MSTWCSRIRPALSAFASGSSGPTCASSKPSVCMPGSCAKYAATALPILPAAPIARIFILPSTFVCDDANVVKLFPRSQRYRFSASASRVNCHDWRLCNAPHTPLRRVLSPDREASCKEAISPTSQVRRCEAVGRSNLLHGGRDGSGVCLPHPSLLKAQGLRSPSPKGEGSDTENNGVGKAPTPLFSEGPLMDDDLRSKRSGRSPLYSEGQPASCTRLPYAGPRIVRGGKKHPPHYFRKAR